MTQLKKLKEKQQVMMVYEEKIWKVVQRCALLSKSSTKMSFQLTVSLDFKIAF